jgi:hypothetical protein
MRDHILAALTGVALAGVVGCGVGLAGPGDPPEADEVVSVDYALKAYAVANTVILATRPIATHLLVERVNAVLANNNILGTMVDSRKVEQQILSPLTDGHPTKQCPYLTKVEKASTVSCRFLVDRAVEDSLVLSSTLKETVEQDVETKYQQELQLSELDYVKGWAGQAVLSGIDVGAVRTLSFLRQSGACDQAPKPAESAYKLGEAQGQALLESEETVVLPTIPKTQCNTDIIATTVLAEAKKKADDFKVTNPVCYGYNSSDLAEAVDLSQAETSRSAGMDQGLQQAYEALRVRLVGSWVCTPPPAPASSSTTSPGNAGDCLCYARHNGTGPVFCFVRSAYSHVPPKNGVVLQNMANAGTVQCQATGAATPVGSPLVVDLDGTGIELRPETVSFDLAATGENVRIPALSQGAALVVLDLDGNGRIESGAELFGNSTTCGRSRCVDGLEALAQHDATHDGTIDARDPVYGRLRLWQDSNRDGQSQPGELRTLEDAGIRAIDLAARLDLAWTDGQGNSATRALSFERRGGGQGVIHDVWFALSFDRVPQDPRSSGIVSTLPQRLR